MTEVTALEAFVAVATSQLGVQEEPRGSNWGTDVAKYLDSVGITTPAPWCAAFTYWCYKQAMAKAGQAKLLLPKTGHANTMYNLSGSFQIPKAYLAQNKAPARGDIFVLMINPKNGAGHVGIVTSVNTKARTYRTIEGNTNDTGEREGYEVCERTRKFDDPQLRGFIRIFK